MAVHVPAWRRLGLTLKNETSSHASPDAHSTSQALESTQENKTPTPSNKKRKRQDATVHKGGQPHGAETLNIKPPRPLPRGQTRENFSHALTKNSNGFDDSPATTPSVTRIDTAGTKQSHAEDGVADSGRHEARANGRAARPRAGEGADSSLSKSVNGNKRSSSEANNGSEPVLDPVERKRIKRLKRAARRQPWLLDHDKAASTKDGTDPSLYNGSTTSPPTQTASPTSASPPPTTQAPHLLYLTTFHTSPTTWKFNKNHQTTLLKHALDPAALPNTYLAALLAYLSGLRGTAARRRILDTARATLAEPADSDSASAMAAPAAAKRDATILKSALKKTLAENEARRPDALETKARRERAEAVLAPVTGVWPEAAAQQTESQRTASQDQFLAADYLPAPEKGFPATPAKGKRVRARKRRTAASESSSSSSSSSEDESSAVSSESSESDSEESSDDGSEGDSSGESSESSSSEDGE